MIKDVKCNIIKTILIKIILASSFNNNIILCNSNKEKKSEKINNKKQCCSEKNNKIEENAQESNNTQDNNNDNNNNGNNNNEIKKNSEDFIKKKIDSLLKKLEDIKKDNEYLNNKIKKQVIDNLKNKIENSNKDNISNIEIELNDLRKSLNLHLETIIKNYIDTVTNINNSIGMLINYNKEENKLNKYTLNIDEISKTEFKKIDDLNKNLENIKENYKNLINNIVSNLKNKYDSLKNKKLDNNIKNNELDIKDEDFYNLTEVTKIIEIDKKLFIFETVLNPSKNEFINKINELYKKLEKNKDLIKYLLNIKDFDKENNLNNKNIDDLVDIYNNLNNLNNKLIFEFNNYKTKQQNKYNELINIYNEFKDIFNFNYNNLKINFNSYEFNNYKDLEYKIKNFENFLNNNIENIINNFKNKISDLKKKYNSEKININININEQDNVKEKFNKLKIIKEEIEKKEKMQKYIVTETLSDDKMVEILNNVKEIRKNVNFKNYENIYNGDIRNNIYHDKNDNYYGNNIITTESENTKNDLSTLLDIIDYINLNYNIKFILKNNGVSDYGGVRRKKFEEIINYILNNEKIESTVYDFTYNKCKSGNYNIFKKIKGYSFKNEILDYNNFELILKSNNDIHKLYYQVLAYICANTICSGYTININLNPLIYKIMLNFDFNIDYNEDAIKNQLRQILTYDDIKYYSTDAYDYLCEEQFLDEVDGVYQEMIDSFFYQYEAIKIFKEKLKFYSKKPEKDDLFKYLGKDKYWELKIFIEGRNKITVDDIINIIDKNQIIDSRRNHSEAPEMITLENAEFMYNCFIDFIKGLSDENIKYFLKWIYGSVTLPKEIHFTFKKSVGEDKKIDGKSYYLCLCHSCHAYFDLGIDYFEDINFLEKLTEKEKEKIKTEFKKELLVNIKNIKFNEV